MAKKEKKVIDAIECESSSGNIFADLDLPHPEERLVKAELAFKINQLIKQKKLTQKKAAELLEIDQPKISLLSTGKLAGFSFERLFYYLNKLGQSITISIETVIPRENKPALIAIFNHSGNETHINRR